MLSIFPSSTTSSNEICSSLASPSKRYWKGNEILFLICIFYVLNTINIIKFMDGFVEKINVSGKAKGVKSEGIEVEIYDGR